jgi:hypothetical protein
MRILFLCLFIFFSTLATAGVSGYKIIFIDLSEGLGTRSLNEYIGFLKENDMTFDSGNLVCWKKRAGNGFDSIKSEGLDKKYFNRQALLSVLDGDHNELVFLQKAMLNTKMELDYGVSIAGADSVYVFRHDNDELKIYGIPLKGNDIKSVSISWKSNSTVPVNLFDKLMCKAAASMDGYFSS